MLKICLVFIPWVLEGKPWPAYAAVAQVCLKTRQIHDEEGTEIEIEGSKIIKQQPVSCAQGTSIAVKNLFFNIPARRNFLKSDTAELRHCMEEFHRIALAYPHIKFNMWHNDNEIYHLRDGQFVQRIVAIFGNSYQERLLLVEEDTDLLKVFGYVGKPEFARKTRGEQYFWVNGRFVKDAYLNHAVQGAFERMLPENSFASYFLYLQLNPAKIDVNIHPTKTEIKFEDERVIYTLLKSAIRKALGKFTLVPQIDFETDPSLNFSYKKNTEVAVPTIAVNTAYNPFDTQSSQSTKAYPRLSNHAQSSSASSTEIAALELLYAKAQNDTDSLNKKAQLELHTMPAQHDSAWQANVDLKAERDIRCFQWNNRFIITGIKSALMIIDQQLAHERIVYETLLQRSKKNEISAQHLLYPVSIQLPQADCQLLSEYQEQLAEMGFDLRPFGAGTMVLHAIPADLQHTEEADIFQLLEMLKRKEEVVLEKQDKIARTLARSLAIKNGRKLSGLEMEALIDQLFACQIPMLSPNGQNIMQRLSLEEVISRFRKI